ncbi:MAG: hypothetical protein OXN26_01810 [Gammaproteobacteria bacterium]|nr:hypothetical protein [Gammaproteobacteria bacterium]
MKISDRYHKWVEWNEEDQVYIGKCPDLITGIHGDNPMSLYGELCGLTAPAGRFQAAPCGVLGTQCPRMMDLSCVVIYYGKHVAGRFKNLPVQVDFIAPGVCRRCL